MSTHVLPAFECYLKAETTMAELEVPSLAACESVIRARNAVVQALVECGWGPPESLHAQHERDELVAYLHTGAIGD